MDLKQILFHGLSNRILSHLTGRLMEDVRLYLDGERIDTVSTHASGRRAFVAKAWLDGEAGAALRFRAAWGEMEGGRIWYQQHAGGSWVAADIHSVRQLDELPGFGIELLFSVNMEHVHKLRLEGPGLLD